MTRSPERPRVVATARSYCSQDGPHQQRVRDAGFELVLAAGDDPHDAATLAALAADADGLILGLDRCDERVFAAAPRLRVVARYGVGTDSVDLEAAHRHGVTVTNTPGANTVAVAELTFALMLTLARDLPAAMASLHGRDWRRVRGWELSGKTLGLVGLGQIGCAVAERARAFGMIVIGHDPHTAAPTGVESVPLAELWPRSDVISLHLGLDASTRHLVNAQTLARCKPGAILVNTARGGLVDEQALAEALRQGQLAGAAADAFETEPPQDSPLLPLPNFVATPHLGATTREAARNMGLAAAADVVAVLTGGQPRYPVALPATPRRT